MAMIRKTHRIAEPLPPVRPPVSPVLVLLALMLAAGAVVAIVHQPVLQARATSFDDQQYVLENPLVQNPSWASCKRFLTEVLAPSTVGGYYQPLNMISLMLDWAMGGRPDDLVVFHRTSLILHVANTLLIIALLYLLIGNPWVAAIVGLLFGVHPMTVEPIPWLGERKTLLAAFFSLWSLIFYVRYSRRPGWAWYLPCALMYVLALLSKPTATPLPLVMLLLDWWPLRRLSGKVLLEKLPLLLVAVVSGIITVYSQAATASVTVPVDTGWTERILVVCHNIVFYPYKTLWPVHLSSHYPFPRLVDLYDPMIRAGFIGTILLIVALWVSLRWTRALVAGWLIWFVAILPTMQVLGFSNVIAADKFLYLPAVGWLLVLTYFLHRLWQVAAARSTTLAAGAKLGTVVLAIGLIALEARATQAYLRQWKDTETLFSYMLKLSSTAPIHNALGKHLADQGRFAEAVPHYEQALTIHPRDPYTHNNLGIALMHLQQRERAIEHFKHAIDFKPGYANAYTNLGNAFNEAGRFPEAEECYRQALRIAPEHAPTHLNLGGVLTRQGRYDEAVTHLTRAIELRPNNANAYLNLANVYFQQRRYDEAVEQLHMALRINPDLKKAQDLLKFIEERPRD